MWKYFVLPLIVLACTTESDKVLPETSAEAMVDANFLKWKKFENKPFGIQYSEIDLDGRATLTCDSKEGVIQKCTKVYRCCGEDPETTYVNGYKSPSQILAELKANILQLDYDSATLSDTSLQVVKHLPGRAESTSVAIVAIFDTVFGYPKLMAYMGEVSYSIYRIDSVHFKP